MNDYERAQSRLRFRCEKCGNEGRHDDIDRWCLCGSTVRRDGPAYRVRTFHGKFTEIGVTRIKDETR